MAASTPLLKPMKPTSGARPTNRATRKPAAKKAVVALVVRDGHARSFHVANVHAATLRPLIVVSVDRKSHLMTDESPVHVRVSREFNGHSVVNHSVREYVTTGGLSTATPRKTSSPSSSAA